MSKHSAPEGSSQGRGSTLPEDQYIGEYRPVAVPTESDCCKPGELESKVNQIDQAYGDKR